MTSWVMMEIIGISRIIIMKIKIGDKIYDSEDEPIMIIMSHYDKQNISNMRPECTKYCSFPDEYDADEIRNWMKTDEKNN